MANHESTTGPGYACELLNVTQDALLEHSRYVELSRCIDYRNSMQLQSPGLYMHVGSHVHAIRTHAQAWGPDIDIVEGAFNAGALMTYGLLMRVADERVLDMPNPSFNPEDVTDSEPRDESRPILKAARRGMYLPDGFPHIFKAAMAMRARTMGFPQEEIETAVLGEDLTKIPSTLRDYRDVIVISEYLAGAAEVVLPLERYAEVDSLDESFSTEQ